MNSILSSQDIVIAITRMEREVSTHQIEHKELAMVVIFLVVINGKKL